MRCENQNETMPLNRFLAKGWVIPALLLSLDLGILLGCNYIINSLYQLKAYSQDTEHPFTYFGPQNLWFHLDQGQGVLPYLYLVILGMLLVLDACLAYQIRVSFSEKTINHGQKGTRRWTTIPEIRQQYKEIPMKDTFYPGKPGLLVSRYKNFLYIDDIPSNNLYLGVTRSGKGEMYVISAIDICSRAKRIEDRPSLIINDPKLELFKMSKRTLEKRGYLVHLLNLDDPLHSMGYNPMFLVIAHYKAGRKENAKQAARSFAFSVFHTEESTGGQDPVWRDTATDLFTALMVAVASDCIEDDQKLDVERRRVFAQKVQAYQNLSKEEQEVALRFYQERKRQWKKRVNRDELDLEVEPVLDAQVHWIPDTEDYEPLAFYERQATCYSCLNFFRELCDRAKSKAGENEEAFEKEAKTALDEYFNSRGKLDYAAALYSTIKNTGDRTKGSVFMSMQSALGIFSLDSIAQLTAENTIDFREIGYGEKPVAIFMGSAAEDRSNHFLISTFISQMNQYLSQLTKEPGATGRLKRNVRFLIDEAGQLPMIENLAGFVTASLGLGLSFDFWIQSYEQFRAKYREEAKTIEKNCMNQIYIKTMNDDSAEEYSEMLGKQTVIELQRTGGKFDLKKSYMETPTEKPLMFPEELAMLKEGESVLLRGIKRTDNIGCSIEGYPIINEYADPPGMLRKTGFFFFVLYKRLFLRDKYWLQKEERYVRFSEELRLQLDWNRRKRGNALMYRNQYLKETFPNPDTIRLQDVNEESRAQIRFDRRVYDPQRVLQQLKQSKGTVVSQMQQSQYYAKIHRILQQEAGMDYERRYALSGTQAPEQFLRQVKTIPVLSPRGRKEIEQKITKELRRSQ